MSYVLGLGLLALEELSPCGGAEPRAQETARHSRFSLVEVLF